MTNIKPLATSKNRPTGPAYRRIARDLRERITQGTWQVGSMLPGRRDLAKEYDVEPKTLQRAILELVDEGLLETHVGRGTFVIGKPTTRDTPIAAAIPASGVVSSVSWGQAPSSTLGRVGLISDVPMSHAEGTEIPRRIFGMEKVRAIENVLSDKYNSELVIYDILKPDGELYDLDEVLAHAYQDGLSGIIIDCIVREDDIDQHFPMLHASPIPLVLISYMDLHRPIPNVFFDQRQAGFQAAHHLLRQGYRDLVFFAPVWPSWAQERYAGVCDAAKMAGMQDATVRRYPEHTDYSIDVLTKPELEVIAMGFASKMGPMLHPRTGIIAMNDNMAALQVFDIAEEHGKTPGRDFGIISFDDQPWTLKRGCSSLRLPFEAMGREAVNLLAAIVNGEATVTEIRLRSHLVSRSSSRSSANGAHGAERGARALSAIG